MTALAKITPTTRVRIEQDWRQPPPVRGYITVDAPPSDHVGINPWRNDQPRDEQRSALRRPTFTEWINLLWKPALFLALVVAGLSGYLINSAPESSASNYTPSDRNYTAPSPNYTERESEPAPRIFRMSEPAPEIQRVSASVPVETTAAPERKVRAEDGTYVPRSFYAASPQEDEPGFDCRTMGNRICGPDNGQGVKAGQYNAAGKWVAPFVKPAKPSQTAGACTVVEERPKAKRAPNKGPSGEPRTGKAADGTVSYADGSTWDQSRLSFVRCA